MKPYSAVISVTNFLKAPLLPPPTRCNPALLRGLEKSGRATRKGWGGSDYPTVKLIERGNLGHRWGRISNRRGVSGGALSLRLQRTVVKNISLRPGHPTDARSEGPITEAQEPGLDGTLRDSTPTRDSLARPLSRLDGSTVLSVLRFLSVPGRGGRDLVIKLLVSVRLRYLSAPPESLSSPKAGPGPARRRGRHPAAAEQCGSPGTAPSDPTVRSPGAAAGHSERHDGAALPLSYAAVTARGPHPLLIDFSGPGEEEEEERNRAGWSEPQSSSRELLRDSRGRFRPVMSQEHEANAARNAVEPSGEDANSPHKVTKLNLSKIYSHLRPPQDVQTANELPLAQKSGTSRQRPHTARPPFVQQGHSTERSPLVSRRSRPVQSARTVRMDQSLEQSTIMRSNA
eukprot:751347-Hanusia_phi.AAC.6